MDELWKRPLYLMTTLRAKGKEFESVILLDVNDGIWPNRNARTPGQREAKRRVFYVAFTRTKKRVPMLVSNSEVAKRFPHLSSASWSWTSAEPDATPGSERPTICRGWPAGAVLAWASPIQRCPTLPVGLSLLRV